MEYTSYWDILHQATHASPTLCRNRCLRPHRLLLRVGRLRTKLTRIRPEWSELHRNVLFGGCAVTWAAAWTMIMIPHITGHPQSLHHSSLGRRGPANRLVGIYICPRGIKTSAVVLKNTLPCPPFGSSEWNHHGGDLPRCL